jgi:hypothetical protein
MGGPSCAFDLANMGAPDDPLVANGPTSDPVRFLADYFQHGGPRFVLVSGVPGVGKSSLLRAVFEGIPGPKLFLLYQQPMAATAGGPLRPEAGGATTVLLFDPQGPPPPPSAVDGPLAPAELKPWGLGSSGNALERAIARLAAAGAGTAVVDSWDRDSERFVRALAPDPRALESVPVPATGFGALQSTLIGLDVNLLLGVVPDLGEPLWSIADAVIELRTREIDGAHVRIATAPKVRGRTTESQDQLYTLDEGTIRPFRDLPRGFVPPVAPLDPDPRPDSGTIWPGSAAFASAFGRLRHGGFTALTLTPECDDPVPTALALLPIGHALRSGGRVIWAPAPSLRPSRAVALLREQVPDDWLRERLRIITASGDDPGLGDLRAVVLPLRRDVGSGGELRAATSPGVTPIFPDAFQFLRLAPDSGSALYVISIEGLKATAAMAEVPLNPLTLPSILASYARLPRFHGFGYGQASDPISTALLSMVTTQLHLQVICGRPVIHGVRPRSPAYILDWEGSDGRLNLRRCA